jgi:hypothetical protein
MAPKQTTYQKATQDRINFTSEVLGNMKAVKMLGFSDKFSQLMERKRESDLNAGKKLRALVVWTNAVSRSLSCFILSISDPDMCANE